MSAPVSCHDPETRLRPATFPTPEREGENKEKKRVLACDWTRRPVPGVFARPAPIHFELDSSKSSRDGIASCGCCDADDVSAVAATANAAIFTEQMVGRNERRCSVSWKAKQINLVYNETMDGEPLRRLTASVHHAGLISAGASLPRPHTTEVLLLFLFERVDWTQHFRLLWMFSVKHKVLG